MCAKAHAVFVVGGGWSEAPTLMNWEGGNWGMQFDPTHESRLHSAREGGEREERFLSSVRRTSEGDDLVE